MCQICRKYICPPMCPSYRGDSAERGRAIFVCAECECYICEYDDYEIFQGSVYCAECYRSTCE